MWPLPAQHRPMLVAARPHPSRLFRIGQSRAAPAEPGGSAPKLVVFVRGDLQLSASKIATTALYAAFALYQQVCERANACSRWKTTGERKSVHRVAGESQLDMLMQGARERKLPAVAVRESERRTKAAVSILGPANVIQELMRGVRDKSKRSRSRHDARI